MNHNPKRILQIVTQMNRGGLETMLMNYYRVINREQFQFDFLVHREEEGAYDQEIKTLGGQIYHVPKLNPFSPGYYKALNHFFSEHKYDVVHCHLNSMSAYPLRAAMKAGVQKRIASSHTSNEIMDIKYPVKLVSKYFIPHYATDLLACGEKAGHWIFPGQKFLLLNNAIDAEMFRFEETIRAEVRNELGIGQSQYVLGHVGRFDVQKNHVFLIDIFEKYHENNPESVLMLVGDGNGRLSMEKLVMEKNLKDSVIFTGVRSDVNRLMQAMDIFVFPSLWEGLPVTLVEAQASGLFCIVSDNVPSDCNLTDNVKSLPLDNVETWVNEISIHQKYKRLSPIDEIKNAGFDVFENLHVLEDLYS